MTTMTARTSTKAHRPDHRVRCIRPAQTATSSKERLAPGTRMRFKDLRARYASGLSPLREALMRLVADDLVILEDHKGFRVAPVSQEELVDLAMTWFELEALGIRQSIEKGDDRWAANIKARFRDLSKHRMSTSEGTTRRPTGSRTIWRSTNRSMPPAARRRSCAFAGCCRSGSPGIAGSGQGAAPGSGTSAKEHQVLCRAVLERATPLRPWPRSGSTGR